MEKREDYLKWLTSKSEKVRNLAFQVAYLNGSVSLKELVISYPELIQDNVTCALKRHPKLLNQFIAEVNELETIPVKLVIEIIGMVSFYLTDQNLDFENAFKLVDDYSPKTEEQGELIVALMVCGTRNERWYQTALAKLEEVHSSIEQPLLAFLQRQGCPDETQLCIISEIMKKVDCTLSAKIVNALLLQYGMCGMVVLKICQYLQEYYAGLPAAMYYLIDILKSKGILLRVKSKIIDCLFEIIITHKILLPQNQRKLFFAELDLWLMEAGGNYNERIKLLDDYLSIFPNDAGKVFRLYNRVIVIMGKATGYSEVSSENWFVGDFSDAHRLVTKAFDAKYIKAIRRYGDKEEQTKAYLLALKGCVAGKQAIRTKAREILALFEGTTYLVGSVMEILPQLQRVLDINYALRPQVNWLLDLLFVKDHPLNHISALNLEEIEAFCFRYSLKADRFNKKYQNQLMDIWERKNEEDKIVQILEYELAI